MRYAIEEHFIDDLERKLNRIARKCAKNGNYFSYRRVGEEVRDVVEHSNFLRCSMKRSYRFIIIEVEGAAKVNGFEFVATLEVHNGGNVIRRVSTHHELPERFRTSGNVCEHCNTRRNREKLYVVYNSNTGEYKQVGGSCLAEYTGGLSAEFAAEYLDGITELEARNNYIPDQSRFLFSLPVERVLAYAVELIDKMGYFNSRCDVPTRMLLNAMLMNRDMGFRVSEVNRILRSNHFSVSFVSDDFNKPGTEQTVREIIQYYKDVNDSSEFAYNVKLFLQDGFVQPKDFGYICYLPEGYAKYQQREIARAERERVTGKSTHFGIISARYKGEAVYSVEKIASYDSMYGAVYVYKITLKSGNVLIWKTSTFLSSTQMETANTIDFTVKAHNEFRGIPQTEITRAKLNYAKVADETVDESLPAWYNWI